MNLSVVSPTDVLNAAILVVDDKEANLRLLEGMLRVAGYTAVRSTSDPTEVCELHARNHYDLILLDLQMPRMDGFEVMAGLRNIEQDGYLPIIALTAQPQHKLRALESGARDFVSKPFDFAELRARVRNALEVRLLHVEARRFAAALEQTVRELETSREVIRLKTLEEQERNEREMNLAQETQVSLLPRLLPQFENYRIHAFNSPTRYVGGDFYDFLQLSSGEWMGVLADVSGKGMPAALLSSMVLGALSMDFRSGTQPADVLRRVNELLCEKSLPYQFITLFLFLFRPNGSGQFISAGHNPACLFRSATGRIEELASEAFAIGMFEAASYPSRAIHLDKGDMLVVYSDGLTDAENAHGEMFGKRRLMEIVGRDAPSGALAVERSLLSALGSFVQDTIQTDDITLVVVEKFQ